MPIIDIQKRSRELGRIRIGQQVPTSNGRTRPEKLDRFRLTSSSKHLLEQVAALYGGTVAEWTPKGGTAQWEVITDSKRIPILVPPQPVSQWLETWTGGGCVHRCDGQTNALTGDPCDPEDPDHQQARPTTRLNVVLRDVEGIGVWRLESHGWNAAMELPNAAEFLSQAGGYIDGHIALEERTSMGLNARTGKPETRRFMVPIIEIAVTPAALFAGEGVMRPPSIEGPVQSSAAAALEAAPRPDYETVVAATTTRDELNEVWQQAKTAGHMDDALGALIRAQAQKIVAAEAAAAQPEQPDEAPFPDEDGAVEAEVVDHDVDTVWQACLAEAGRLGMSLWDVEKDFQSATSMNVSDADAAALTTYLEDLRRREAA